MQIFKRKITAITLSLAMLFSVLPMNVAQATEADMVQSNEETTKKTVEDQGVSDDAASAESLEGQTAAEEVQDCVEPQLQYLYVDSPYLMTPDTQKIMVSFQDGVVLRQASLVYEKLETAEQYEVQAEEVQDSTAVFSIEYLEESVSGTYHLVKVRSEVDGVTHEIDLGEIGIDSRFGVNQECDTEPDAVVEEADAETSRSASESGEPVSFMTFDDNGDLVESESAEDAIQESAAGTDSENTRAASERAGNIVVVIDPGHGGFDPGAIGINGASEKNLTLKIAQYCKEELEQYGGVTVYMTRTSDTHVGSTANATADIKARVEYAKSVNADILVSIHLNSTGNGKGYGAEVYYPNSNYNAAVGSEGQALAQKIQNELVSLGLYNRGIKVRPSANGSTYPDGSVQDYYGLIWQSKRAGFPAIIVEHAFIDNVSDYNNYLSSDAKLKKLGQADAAGIAKTFNLSKGRWELDANGWKYIYADGSLAKNTWAAIGGSWYYFGTNGYMQTGWLTVGGQKYYLNPVSGAMQTGWLLLDNQWYYFNESGAMVTGWQWIGNKCYYFQNTGIMAANMWIGNDYVDGSGAWVPGFMKPTWIQSGSLWWYRHSDGSYTRSNWELIDGAWYYFDANGWMTTGWQLIGGAWYYMNASGQMQTGWQTIGEKKYYLNASGLMAVGWQWIGEKCYYFDASGAMAANTWIGNDYVDGSGAWIPEKVRDGWIQSGNLWWYRHSDGSYTRSNWELIDGAWYYFDANGWMTTGWQMIGGGWYYMNASGQRQTGWQWIGDKCYYLDDSGLMAADTWIGNDYVDGSGAWIPGKVRDGWIQSGNLWWYRHSDGSYTRSNWELINRTWYYFDANGWMQTGWIVVGNSWYYLSESGAMHKGWLEQGENWYYLNPASGSYGAEGAMATGYREIGGVWYYFSRTKSPVGALYYTGVTPIMGKTLLGDKNVAIQKMVKMYMRSGRTYPGDKLKAGGAADITAFCQILYEEALAEGVKPEVVFGQAMNETGYLQFGGDVKIEQYNFAGLGATGNGNPGLSFADVRTGLRAQVQHLKAYASKEALNQTCVDSRFAYVTRNSAPYVEWLGIKENPQGKGWAATSEYGMNLMKLYINPLYTL